MNKKVTRKFKSGGLHERHVVATWKLGTISAFACRHRETKKNPRRGGRSQDLKLPGNIDPVPTDRSARRHGMTLRNVKIVKLHSKIQSLSYISPT